MYNRQRLAELVKSKALRFGDFTLASGKKAKFYLDCRKVTLDSRGAKLIGAGMLELLGDKLPHLVGGMAIGADPITAAILTLAGVQGKQLRGVMVRKEPKQHGTGKYVEGPYAAGEELVIVEDVVTTGLSSRETVEAVRAIGGHVVAEACLIDRSGGEADVGVPLIALARFKVPAYPADRIPPEMAAIPPVKPGSRGLQQ